ncbi:phosphotransferase family protein [Halalkalibacter urbisdiaboli]|uniref:phosphotransferase family protein n=1 Tax=Halalkalibacter urbisdiaboli TaxID=1960589 RepID=UPI000B4547A3|nr:aminoglycoside phosphotransferase family protein [Halalkalibacter urbisdiaboli]
MKLEIQTVSWKIKNIFFNSLLYNELSEVKKLSEGQEAEIFILIIESEYKCIIKKWRKGFRVNVKKQFAFLEKGLLSGLPVPFPYTWGIDENGVQYLVMSYAGSTIKTPSDNQMKLLASVLSSIHQSSFTLNEVKNECNLFNEMINDYFPSLDTQSDIANLIQQLKNEIPIRKPTLIHGDFNLGNVLFREKEITVIDWTNARIGDFRYDFSWAYFLLWLYSGEKPSCIFADTYKSLLNYTVIPLEFESFECIAALRWLLLNRLFSLPQGIEKQELVKRFIKERIPERLGGDFDVY